MKTSRHVQSMLITVAFAVLPGIASFPARAESVQTVAAIRFSGSSTLHDFSGTAESEPFTLTWRESDGGVVLEGAGEVSVSGMSTGHGKRDRNMRTMLRAAEFPAVTAEITNAAIATNGTADCGLALTIAGRTQEVVATVSDCIVRSGGVQATVAFDVSLAAFGLKPPAVLGVIRVGDRVRVMCDLQPAVAAAAEEGRTP